MNEIIFSFICIVLMILMTFGVILMYASMVRVRYVEHTLMTGTVSILFSALLWLFIAGDFSIYFGLSLSIFSETISDQLKILVELFFYLYAVTMLIGSILERGNWKYIVGYIAIWTGIVYVPIANYMWGQAGYFASLQEMLPSFDFSGGLVVHATAGIGSLILCLNVPSRRAYESTKDWQKVTMLIATVLIIVGWICFNMAPVGQFNDQAVQVVINTLIFVVCGGLSGFVSTYLIDRTWRSDSLLNGVITALVSSTTSVGLIGISEAVIIAVVVPFICPFVIQFINQSFDFDDAVDSFGMNAVGGVLGAVLAAGLVDGGSHMVNELLAIVIIVVWSFIGAGLTKKIMTLFFDSYDENLVRSVENG